jgi:hypothetical protein
MQFRSRRGFKNRLIASENERRVFRKDGKLCSTGGKGVLGLTTAGKPELLDFRTAMWLNRTS